MGGNAICLGRQVKSRAKTGKILIFPGKLGENALVLPWKDKSPYFTHS